MPKAARPVASLSKMARSKPAAKKLKMLREREARRNAKIVQEVQSWFEQFDINGDGMLQRDELRALLTHLNPYRPPTEDNLSWLLEKATEIRAASLKIPGNKDGAVSLHQARATVTRYHEYCKDQAYLDAVFRKFDADGSGTLDEGELLPLLQRVAPEGCIVDDSDVAYVLEACDVDGDGVISREEVLPMISKWTQLAIGKLERQKLSESQQRWAAIRSAALTTQEVLTPIGQRLVSVVAGARAREERRTAITQRWRRAEKTALLAHSEDDTDGHGPLSGASMLARVVNAAAAERKEEHAAKRAELAEAAAVEEETAVLEALAKDPLTSLVRTVSFAAPDGGQVASSSGDGSCVQAGHSVQQHNQSAEEKGGDQMAVGAVEPVEPDWDDFHFTGPAGERMLLPRRGSSMDALARSRRGSLDHAVPGSHP